VIRFLVSATLRLSIAFSAGLAFGAQPDFGSLALRLGGGTVACDGGCTIWYIRAFWIVGNQRFGFAICTIWYKVAIHRHGPDPEDASDLALRQTLRGDAAHGKRPMPRRYKAPRPPAAKGQRL